MNIQDFIQEFVDTKITNTRSDPNAVNDFIKSKLNIRTYIPFAEKRRITELVVSANITEEHNIKKIDSAGQFVGFVISMIMTHTDLEFGQVDPVQSYDALSEVGLIEPIIECFQKDYSECEVLLKMAVSDVLEDNNVNVLIGRFLDYILDKLDDVSEALNKSLGDFDISKLLGTDIKQEDLAKLSGLIDRLK